jgi:hypothetical protein
MNSDLRMVQLILKLSKGSILREKDRKLLCNTPSFELKALLKYSEKDLHPGARTTVEEILSARERAKKSLTLSKKKKRQAAPKPIAVLNSPTFAYLEHMGTLRKSVRTWSGGGCNPR